MEVGQGMDLLKDYAEELRLSDGNLTLEQLIDSHRSQRQMVNGFIDQRNADLERVRERVRQMEMDSTWVKVERLRQMSVQEFATLIGE